MSAANLREEVGVIRLHDGGFMGTWDLGPFDNDAASDWLQRVHGVEDVKRALAGSDEECVAAVAVVAWAADGFASGAVPRSLRSHRRKLAALQGIAASAGERVVHHSRLRDLWEESGQLPQWEAQMVRLVSSLGGVVAPPVAEEEASDDPVGAPVLARELPPELVELYAQNRDPERHATFPYELRTPAFLQGVPAELLVLGLHRASEDLLVVETHDGTPLRLLRWSLADGASACDLVEPLDAPPPSGLSRFATSDGCELWLEQAPQAEALVEARGRWWDAIRSDDVEETEEAEWEVARAQLGCGRVREARHHAAAGNLVERAMATELVPLVTLAGAIFGTELDDADQRRVQAAAATPLLEVLRSAGLVSEATLVAAAAKAGKLAALLRTDAPPASIERGAAKATPREVLDALVEVSGGAPSLREKLASSALSRGMERWTLEEIAQLLELGARPTPFAQRKAKRRRDGDAVMAVLALDR